MSSTGISKCTALSITHLPLVEPLPWRTSPGGARCRGAVGRLLEPVVERRELDRAARAVLQPPGDQPVGEPGVLGQQGPMEVGADHAPADAALAAVLAVVAVPVDHPAERPRARAQAR